MPKLQQKNCGLFDFEVCDFYAQGEQEKSSIFSENSAERCLTCQRGIFTMTVIERLVAEFT